MSGLARGPTDTGLPAGEAIALFAALLVRAHGFSRNRTSRMYLSFPTTSMDVLMDARPPRVPEGTL